MEHQSKSLIDYFMERMVEPVVSALKEKDFSSEEFVVPLKRKIEQLGENLVSEINRSKNSAEVSQTITYLLDKVDEMEYEAPSPLSSTTEDLSTEGMSITEMVLLNTLCSSDSMQSSESEIKECVESPPPIPDDSVKGMSSRKRAKRSLEDTVQMLSKENSTSPPPPINRIPVPFVIPPVPFPHTVMHRWLGSPFANPVYMNMFQPPKPSEEQLAALMKMSMHAANIFRNASHPPIPIQPSCPESDTEDIKIEVESDEGEVSPSPSNGDITENESSSSSSGAMTSPTSGDGDSMLEKPFICMHNNCGKRFANKFLLKKHMFIHTGLRPHTCPHCHKKFNRKDNLLRHKKTHNPVESHIPILPKNPFPALTPIPGLHNIALTQGFSHFHALKMSLENGATAVRSLS
uniref:Zinc finger protein n=1 Tax=Caenorhabditis tropicalis TaxID=1561998 RepID=A0A1I7UPU2_9PELO